MGILQSLERRLQGAVGNTFARLFGGKVQPAEVASALQREAISRVRAQGSRTVVPNHYVVRLGPSDISDVGANAERVSGAFEQMLHEYFDEHGWDTFGSVAVTLEQSDVLHTGQFRIASVVDPDVDRRRPAQQAGGSPMTQHSDRARPAHPDQDPHGYPAPGVPGAAAQFTYGEPRYDVPGYPVPQPHPSGHPEQGWPEQPGGYPGAAGQPGYGEPHLYGQPAESASSAYPPPPPSQPHDQQGQGYQQPYDQPGHDPQDYSRPYDQQDHGQSFHGHGYEHGHEQGHGYGGGHYPAPGADPYPRSGPVGQPYGASAPPSSDQQSYGPPGYQQPYPDPAAGFPGPYTGQPSEPTYEPTYEPSHAPSHEPDYGQPGQQYGQPPYQQPGYAPLPRAVLAVEDGSGRTHELRQGSNVIGRGQDAEFRLADTSVSRRHVDVYFDGHAAVLHDLGSTNGTLVNGSSVQTWQLADGDVIRIGHSTVVFRLR